MACDSHMCLYKTGETPGRLRKDGKSNAAPEAEDEVFDVVEELSFN